MALRALFQAEDPRAAAEPLCALAAQRRHGCLSVTRFERAGSQDWDRLIQAVAVARDREAFSRLFDHFAGRIKTYMLRSGASEAAADDLAQEAMLTVWRKAALFDPSRAGAAAWIFTIARNLRIDAARRDRRGGARNLAEVDSEFDIDSAPLPDDRLVAAESVQLLRSALTKLSLAEIRVIEMSFFQDKAHAEIARVLEIPLGTVKSRVRRAIMRLRTLISGVA
jgi:RNA polymerase sigma-70 factor, ECF subfamily